MRVTERYGQILGASSTSQNRENNVMNMLVCPETFILQVIAERMHGGSPPRFGRAVRDVLTIMTHG
jgi:hypothetical protein